MIFSQKQIFSSPDDDVVCQVEPLLLLEQSAEQPIQLHQDMNKRLVPDNSTPCLSIFHKTKSKGGIQTLALLSEIHLNTCWYKANQLGNEF